MSKGFPIKWIKEPKQDNDRQRRARDDGAFPSCCDQPMRIHENTSEAMPWTVRCRVCKAWYDVGEHRAKIWGYVKGRR